MRLLEFIEPGQLSLDLSISYLGLQLLFLNLFLGSTSLGAGFHEMRSYSFTTAYVSTGMEDGQNIRVHLNLFILLLEELFVAYVDLSFHPCFEWHTNESVNDVDDVLAWKLHDLVFWRKSLCNGGIDLGKAEEVGDGEAFELWHIVNLDGV